MHKPTMEPASAGVLVVAPEERRRRRYDWVYGVRRNRDVDKLVESLKTVCGPAWPMVLAVVDDYFDVDLRLE